MTSCLAPFAFSVFQAKANPSRQETISIINRIVNMGIVVDERTIPLAQEVWSIGPVRGQCHDYAVTKQWPLDAFDIKSHLCEVEIQDGQHHVVLIVDDVVLDSLAPLIEPMPRRYKVIRTQSLDVSDEWDSP